MSAAVTVQSTGGSDRIVFGSDFPTIPHQIAAQVSGLAGLGLGEDWLRAVLWENGTRLFGLSDAAARLPR